MPAFHRDRDQDCTHTLHLGYAFGFLNRPLACPQQEVRCCRAKLTDAVVVDPNDFTLIFSILNMDKLEANPPTSARR